MPQFLYIKSSLLLGTYAISKAEFNGTNKVEIAVWSFLRGGIPPLKFGDLSSKFKRRLFFVGAPVESQRDQIL